MTDIYLITNLINGKQYVGKTKNGYINRFNHHCLAYEHGCRNYISCAIHKYGKNNFKVCLITQVPDTEWDYWETYYIKQFKTHYTQGGYNITWGGDFNPMEEPLVQRKHWIACHTDEFIQKQRSKSTGRTHSEYTKKLCRKRTLDNLDICIAGFRKYNKSKQIPVGMIKDDTLIKTFESLSDASKYLTGDSKSCGAIKRYADKINKNGKRAVYLGYSWMLL